jgi:hypothetical protein
MVEYRSQLLGNAGAMVAGIVPQTDTPPVCTC